MFRSKLFSAAVMISAVVACAQNQPEGPGGQGGGFPGQQGGRGFGGQGGPGGFGGGVNIDQFKATLHAGDDEWKVISPAIRKVIAARRVSEAGLLGASNGGGGGRRGFGGPGGRGGPGGNDAFGGPNNQRPGMGGDRGGQGGFGPPPDGQGPPPGPQGMGNPDNMQINAADVPGGPDQQGDRRGNMGGQGQQGGPGGQGQGGPGMGGPGGPGGMGGMMGGGATGPVATAMADLKTAADSGKATPEELKAKVEAVRTARTKAREALADAVKELQAVVSPDQESALIGLGVLE